jgi:hypothetical protein
VIKIFFAKEGRKLTLFSFKDGCFPWVEKEVAASKFWATWVDPTTWAAAISVFSDPEALVTPFEAHPIASLKHELSFDETKVMLYRGHLASEIHPRDYVMCQTKVSFRV